MEVINAMRKKTIEKRLTMSAEMINRRPDCVPVVVDRYDRQHPTLTTHKYLCNSSDEIGLLLVLLRRNMSIPLHSSNALFLFSEKHKTLISPHNNIGDVYVKYADDDRFLYLCYSIENTFGEFY